MGLTAVRHDGMAVSIHPVPPADHLVLPRGLAGPLPVRHPTLLFPTKEHKVWSHTNIKLGLILLVYTAVRNQKTALIPVQISLESHTDLFV